MWGDLVLQLFGDEWGQWVQQVQQCFEYVEQGVVGVVGIVGVGIVECWFGQFQELVVEFVLGEFVQVLCQQVEVVVGVVCLCFG